MKNRSVLGIIFLTVFIDMLGFGMILPLLPIWAEQFTANAYVIISLSSVYSLAQFIFAPIWGAMSDRVGRRPIILMSLIGASFAYLGMAYANHLWALYAARIVQGVFTAGGIAAAPALIADVTEPKDRSKGMGMIGAAFGLGFIFGPALGGILAKWGTHIPFFVAAGLALVNFLWASVKLPETHPNHTSTQAVAERSFQIAKLREAFRHPDLAFLLILAAVNTFAFSNLESTFTLFLQAQFHLAPKAAAVAAAGEILAFVGFIAVIIQGGLIGRLTKKFGETKLLVWGIGLTGIGMLLVPSPHSIPGLLGALTILSVGVGIANPSSTSLISQAAAEDRQGGVFGISQGMGSLARIFGPQWGGWTFASIGIAWPYWTGGLILVVSCTAAAVRLLPARLKVAAH